MKFKKPISIFESLVLFNGEVREGLFIWVKSIESYYVRVKGTEIVYVVKCNQAHSTMFNEPETALIQQLTQIISRETEEDIDER